MGEAFDKVRDMFKTMGWPATPIEGQPVLRISDYTGVNGRWTCFAQVVEAQSEFVFYSVCSVNVPPEKRPAMAEFLTRANYGLIIGNFEMDYRDGEVRFKTSTVLDEKFETGLLQGIVQLNVLTLDKYLPGMLKITYGSMTPTEAIDQLEGPGALHA
ncbi:MAG: YbjN domain-containing protein [Anaerolineae bacterium]